MKKNMVAITLGASLISFLFLLVGFGWTIYTQFIKEEQKLVVHQTEEVKTKQVESEKIIVAIGDSLTRGTGDAGGRGYIGYLVEQLQEKSKEEITIHNLGVTGYRSSQLLELVKKEEVKRQISQADIVVMTIGGNDLFQGGQTLFSLNQQKIEQQKSSYLKNLEQILSQIRETNKETVIYLVGLYNPFIDLSDAQVTTEVVRQWNFETSKLLDRFPNTVFVPTFDLFQLKVNDYLYTDKFHPNTEGHKVIAERVASLITW